MLRAKDVTGWILDFLYDDEVYKQSSLVDFDQDVCHNNKGKGYGSVEKHTWNKNDDFDGVEDSVAKVVENGNLQSMQDDNKSLSDDPFQLRDLIEKTRSKVGFCATREPQSTREVTPFFRLGLHLPSLRRLFFRILRRKMLL